MPTTPQTTPRSLTLEHWSQIVTQHSVGKVEPPQKRQEHRRQADSPAKLLIRLEQSGSSEPIIVTCSLLQVSPHGLMVKSQAAIPRSTPVAAELHMNDEILTLTGRVVHCTSAGDAHKLGIELDFGES